MRMRTTGILAAVFAAAVWAAPAQAEMVYVKNPGGAEPAVYVADDRGKNPRRLGIGRAPTIAPNGQWVAFIAAPAGGRTETVVLQKRASGSQRVVMSGRSINSLRFAADSRKLGAITGGDQLRVYDIPADRVHATAEGNIRGYSFSPDSERIVFGRARRDRFQATSDLYIAPVFGGGELTRVTQFGRAVNPVWGPAEILFDRFKRRRGDAPAFNLWAVEPAQDGRLRRLTALKIPRLVSGLVPLEVSSDGRRLLSVFTGQNTEVGFTVATRNGETRALSRDFERGIVGFDLSADGKRILAHTGGWDPSAAHDVISMPYGGGRARVLVEDAAYPDWTE
jgi:dipeptidyl aminopeptidase/acylaminoacyl peptidase